MKQNNLEQELYKEVKKVELSTVLPNYNFPPGFNHAIIDENNNILNFCASRYSLTLNKDIFLPIEEELNNRNIPFIKKTCIIGNSKFYVDYIIRDKQKTASINDVFPKISIWNSYDGVIKFRREMGFYKLICENGLTRPVKGLLSKSNKHTTDSENIKELVAECLNESISFLKEANDDMDIFEKMNQKTIRNNQLKKLAELAGLSNKILKIAEERFALETKGGSTYVNEYGELVEHDGSPKTLFTMYNAFNYALYNTNEKELPEKKLDKDKKILHMAMRLL